MAPKPRFTEKQADRIRSMREKNWTLVELAEKFNTDKGTIARVCTRKGPYAAPVAPPVAPAPPA